MANKKKNSSVRGKKKEMRNDKEKKEKISVEEISKEKSDDFKNDPSLSVIDTQELNHLIENDLMSTKRKEKKHILVHFFLILLLLASLGSFGITILDKHTSIYDLISSLFLTIFTLFFVVISTTYKRQKKGMIFLGSLLLLGYFILGLNSYCGIIDSPISTTPDFSGKSITEVIKWASKNSVTIHQEYEYSDMISEYRVISQDIEAGTKLSDIDSITISISEGPNPSKEIMVPSMIGWDSERVIRFVLDNYLSNVDVEFIESDKAKDTVIEQSASGSFKRDDELKLTFSYGEELEYEEVTLIDFTNKSQFEVKFYMKQNQLNYEFKTEFDKKIKKGYAVDQSVKAGEVVFIHDEVVTVTISKGPEIKVPDFTKYDMEKVTEWAIENKVKINFSDSYDDTVKENAIIRADYSEGDIIEQGTVVKIVISRGSLTMPKFKALSDFREWADKYEIAYEEEHEFSDTVEAGEVISYSYKTGATIKNNDTILVKISDGAKKTVPNLKGLTKSEAISKLEKVGLKYNFIYKNSSEAKDKVLSQSISSGSEVSSGTTITITLSNGKTETVSNNSTSKSESSNSGSNNNSNLSNTSDDNNTPKACTSYTIRISEISSILDDYNTCSSASSGLKSRLESKYSGLKVNVSCRSADGYLTNDLVDGFKGGTTDSCSTISIVLAN